MEIEQRLIDANKIKYRTIGAGGWNRPENVVSDYEIEKMPTVDAVPVVRCKDCKHYDNSEGIQWCKLNSKFYPGGFDWHSFPEDGFCYYGERRTDG